MRLAWMDAAGYEDDWKRVFALLRLSTFLLLCFLFGFRFALASWTCGVVVKRIFEVSDGKDRHFNST